MKRYGTDISGHLRQAETQFKKDVPETVVSRIPKAYFSPVVQSYLGAVLDAIRGIKAPDGYVRFRSAIVAIEAKAVSDKSLSAKDQQQVLIVASVARYSVGFWMGKMADGSTNHPADTMGFSDVSCRQSIAGWQMPKGPLTALEAGTVSAKPSKMLLLKVPFVRHLCKHCP